MLDRDIMKQAQEYNPFGRAGGGAPNRDLILQGNNAIQ
jgi:hypothetical protein